MIATHLCSTRTRISLHGYCSSPYMILVTDHCYYMYMLHRYYDPSHYMYHFTDTRFTGITATYTHHTSVHACVGSIFLSYGSPCILHVLLFHVPVFMLYDCFLLLIWIFPLLDMRAVDMRYVGIPHLLFPFPVILFMLYCSRFPLYCSLLSTELRSSYHVTRIMYCIYSLYT